MAGERPQYGLILLLAIIMGGGLLCGGTVVGLSWWGLELTEQQVGDTLRYHPEILARLGEVESFEMNLNASLSEEDADVFVYDVVGSKSRGVVRAVSESREDGNAEEIVWATLKLPSGETIELPSARPEAQ